MAENRIEYVATLGAKIKVVGVGGGGGNAIDTMLSQGLSDVDFWVANTDAQALQNSRANNKIQLGVNITQGLGAGADPQKGKMAAEEDYERIKYALGGADMVFITAGMGGGTGTGAAPVIAKVAKELGALTVAVVTTPFMFEGLARSRKAQQGISELIKEVDTIIVIPNENLLSLIPPNQNLKDSFALVNQVLFNAVQGISDLINKPGLINVDFADVRSIMSQKGYALMGTGCSSGPDRAMTAAKQAISSPLLNTMNIKGATGILINFSGKNVSLNEVSDATRMIKEDADIDVNLIFGCTVDEQNLDDDMIRITVIATGFQSHENTQADANHTKAPMNVKPPEKTPQSPLVGSTKTGISMQSQNHPFVQQHQQTQISGQNNYVNKPQPAVNTQGGVNKTPIMIHSGVQQTFAQNQNHLGLNNMNMPKPNPNPNPPYAQKTNFPVNNGMLPPNGMINTPYIPSYQPQQAYQSQSQAQVQPQSQFQPPQFQPQSQFQAQPQSQFQAQPQSQFQAQSAQPVNQVKVQQQYVPMQPAIDQNKGFNARNENVNSIRSKTPDVPNSDLSDNFWGEDHNDAVNIDPPTWSKKNN